MKSRSLIFYGLMLFLLGLFLDEALNDAAADCSEAQPIQVLFLGNSYISTNSLPRLEAIPCNSQQSAQCSGVG